MTGFSYQLYSSRNFPPIEATLRMLAQMGYGRIEGYSGLFMDAAGLATLEAAMEETGLTMPTAHFGMPQVQDTPGDVVALAKRLGVETVMVPAIEDRVKDAAGWAAFGKELAEAGKPLLDAGLGFGWHNHAFEYADLGTSETPLQLIMAGSEDLKLELDLAWVQVGGHDPVAEVQHWADRLIAVHVKDIAPEKECVDEDGWADVGHGVMDWPAIVAAVNASSAEYLVMEHDNPSDHARFAARSIEAAKAMGWTKA